MKANLFGLGLAGSLLALSMSGATAGTIPYPNTGTTNPDTYNFTAASTGNLTAYFYGSTAADSEYLNIYDTTTNTSLTGIFPNQTTPTGATATMSVNAGDTLAFTIYDQSTSTTISSVPSANADGAQHIYSTPFAGGYVNVGTDSGQSGANIPAGTYVGFEDTLFSRNSDKNYADEQFVFSDTAISTNGGAPQVTDVPEPASLMILGTAFAGFAVVRRKRRAS
jgi:hypothetical protein